MSYLAVQTIRFFYTDDHRGRVHAERRARLRALPLAARAGEGVLHDCEIRTWVGYEPTETTYEVPLHRGECQLGSLTLRPEDDALVFDLGGGARSVVHEGQWARVVMNEKGGRIDFKWLVELVVNAGVFAGPPAKQVFFGTPLFEQDRRHDFLHNGTLER